MSEIDVVVNGVRYVPESDCAPEGDCVEYTPPVNKEFDSTAFYSSIRKSLFGGSLNQGQVDGINLLLKYLRDVDNKPWIELSAYMLATFYHETASTMQPIKEYGGSNTRYAPWYGRGFVQLTWEENYLKQQTKLKDFEKRPDDVPYQVHDQKELALHPDTSALISIYGMLDGDFTGVGLGMYINESKTDYVNARRVVNGTDKAEMIAGYAELFENAIVLGMDAR